MRMNRLVVRQAAAGLVDRLARRWDRPGSPCWWSATTPVTAPRTSRPTPRQWPTAPGSTPAASTGPCRHRCWRSRCGTSALARGHGHRQPQPRRQRLQGVPGRRGADRAARRRPHRRRHRRRGGPRRTPLRRSPVAGRPRRDHRGVPRRVADPLRSTARGPSRSCTRRSAVWARGSRSPPSRGRLRRPGAGRRPGPSGPRLPRPAVPEPGGAGRARPALANGARIDADLVLAQDPDADRLGVAVPTPGSQPAGGPSPATRSARCWPITCCATARAPTGWWWRPWCRPGWSSAWPRRPACTTRRR